MFIACLGLNCVDIVITCEEFPVEDIDQKVEAFDRRRGGNASNSCTVLSHLGMKCEYLGSISATDSDAKFLMESFNNQGIRIGNCQLITPYKTLNVAVICNKKTHSRTILRPESISYPEYSFENFKSLNFDTFKWLHFEGRRNIDEIKRMIEFLNHHYPTVLLSLEIEKIRLGLLDILPLVDVAFLSKDMAIHLGYSTMDETVIKMVSKMKKNAILICPWGDKGAAGTCNRVDSSIRHSPQAVVSPASPLPVNCVGDSLGAGDTFIAGVVALLSEVHATGQSVAVSGAALRLVLDWANHLAGFKCQHVGFQCVSQCREMLGEYVEKIVRLGQTE